MLNTCISASESGELLLATRSEFAADFANRLCAITHGYALCCTTLHRKRYTITPPILYNQYITTRSCFMDRKYLKKCLSSFQCNKIYTVEQW